MLSFMLQSQIFYVGHSMGSSEFLACMSQRPEEQDKLLAAFLFAPPSYMSGMTGPLLNISQRVDAIEIFLEQK